MKNLILEKNKDVWSWKGLVEDVIYPMTKLAKITLELLIPYKKTVEALDGKDLKKGFFIDTHV